MFEVVIINGSPNRWERLVYNRDGIPIVEGWERSRAAAKYQGERALFMLLASGWKTIV